MDAADPHPRPLAWGWLLAITAAAVALRLRHLGIQILGGDELHLLLVVSTRPLAELPGTVTGWDFSIPLAIALRTLSGVVPLDEWLLRAPVLLAGCVTPALAALMARRFVSTPTALALGWLVAAHPFFIFYSRFLRPYALCLALLLLALLHAACWARDRDRRSLVWLCALSALATWFQPIAIITVALLFAGLLGHELLRRAATPAARPGRIVLAGVATLAATLALYAPAAEHLVERMVVDKVGVGQMTLETALHNTQALVGLGGRGPLLVFLAATLCGAGLLARRLGARALLLLVPLLGQPAIITLLQPSLIDDPLVLARYQLYVLPIAWLCVCVLAAGLLRGLWNAAGRPAPGLLASDHTGPTIALVLSACWVLLGPYASIYRADNAYAHHHFFQSMGHEQNRYWQTTLDPESDAPLHPYYRQLEPNGAPVLEWPPSMGFTKTMYHFAQARHGRPVQIIARPEGWWWLDDRLDLANVVDLSADAPFPDLEPGTVVLLHRNPVEEGRRFAQGRPTGREPGRSQRQAFARMRQRLVESVGEPTFEDGFLTVFER